MGKHKAWHPYRVIVSLPPTIPSLVRRFDRSLHSRNAIHTQSLPKTGEQTSENGITRSLQRLAYTAFLSRELLLIDGLLTNGMGSWADAAEHVGTRTREEAERHYNEVYVDSADWPMPVGTHFEPLAVSVP